MVTEQMRCRWRLIGQGLLFLEAATWLVMTPLLLRLIPFGRLTPWLGERDRETGEHLTPRQREVVYQVQAALAKGSSYTPWTTSCLMRSFTTAMLLRRRRIAYTLYLGARLTPHGLEAHAWVRSGQILVTGARGESRFTVVAIFAYFPLLHPPAGD